MRDPAQCAGNVALDCRVLHKRRVFVYIAVPNEYVKGLLKIMMRNPSQSCRTCLNTISIAVQEEVSRHEPVSALDGGPNTGVRDLLAVCSQAGDMLAQGGFLGLETLGELLLPRQSGLQRCAGL